jgi:hypothetical protein
VIVGRLKMGCPTHNDTSERMVLRRQEDRRGEERRGEESSLRRRPISVVWRRDGGYWPCFASPSLLRLVAKSKEPFAEGCADASAIPSIILTAIDPAAVDFGNAA